MSLIDETNELYGHENDQLLDDNMTPFEINQFLQETESCFEFTPIKAEEKEIENHFPPSIGIDLDIDMDIRGRELSPGDSIALSFTSLTEPNPMISMLMMEDGRRRSHSLSAIPYAAGSSVALSTKSPSNSSPTSSTPRATTPSTFVNSCASSPCSSPMSSRCNSPVQEFLDSCTSPNVNTNSSSPSSSRRGAIRRTRSHDDVFQNVAPYLHLPQHEAAKTLGIPSSTLSKRWKEATNNRKWPFRELAKLDKEIVTLAQNAFHSLHADKLKSALERLVLKRKEVTKEIHIRMS